MMIDYKIFKMMRVSVLLALFGLLIIQPVSAQSGTVRGTVTDNSGEPLQGATVRVKNTTNGVVSDAKGNYQINNVPDKDAVLIVSYVGFVTKEATVGSLTVVNVVLDEEETLDEVVVVGYGTQKKASLTGSVATLNVNEIRSVPAGNLANAIAGRLTGVTVAQQSGGRPGNSADITVRARGTWNSTAPLYVIDGVVRDLQAFNAINANDIDNFSILKDAAAASVYGARAANGVILVTTKQGQEGRARISYSGSVSFGDFAFEQTRQSLEQSIRMANNMQMEYRKDRKANADGTYLPYSFQPLYSSIYKNGSNASDGYIDAAVITDEEAAFYRSFGGYDSYAAVYQTPVTSSHSLNVSGGTDRTKYYIGGSYYNEPGIAKALSYEKYTIRSNVETKIAQNWTASLSINTNKSVDTRSAGEDLRGSNLYAFMVRTTPFRPFKSKDGRYFGSGHNMDGENPLAKAEGAAGYRDNIYWNVDYNAALKWNVPWIKGLSARVSFSQYTRNRLDKEHYKPYLVYMAKKGESVNNHIFLDEVDETKAPMSKGAASLTEEKENSSNYQFNGVINYHNTFGKHDVGATLVYEQYENSGEWTRTKIEGMKTENLPYFEFGQTEDKNKWEINGNGYEDARLSYVGRFNYGFDNRYLAEFSFRRDASVKFDPEHRWGFFPSGSAAWRVSEEKFFKNNIPFINNLKLRGSVGLTGNDAVGAYQWMDRANISENGGYFGGTALSNGVSFGAIPNPLITWEKSLSYNGALEMGLINDMFTLGAEYFFRKTYDILGPRTAYLPDTFGGTISDSNYGIVNSFGYEFELGFNRQITKDLSIRVKGNFGWADSEIVEWAEPGVSPHLSKIGKNWDRQAGYLSDGIIWDIQSDGSIVENGETIQTFRITTSTGNVYNGVRNDYCKNTDATNNGITIEKQGYGELRPGNIFPVDIHGMDKDGNLTAPDGILTPGDADKFWMIEHFNPPYNYGFSLNVSWKGITVDALFQGTAGNQAMLQFFNASGSGYDNTVQGWWAEDAYSYNNNPTGKFPIVVNGASRPSTNFWVRDASFLRLKSASISYDFPKKWLTKAGLSQARIYVSGYNLALLWNSLKYIDPELVYTPEMQKMVDVNKTGSYIDGGVAEPANHTYPLARTITIGLNLTF
jgi:TonB-linked SusC/RagA family outer membrane protein